MGSIIQLENIQKSYYLGKQELKVLKGITLEVFKNEYVALMGPSGSGKSTLMNMLYGLLELYQGIYVMNSGVAHFAHLGGMLGGLLMMRYWRGQPPFRRR